MRFAVRFAISLFVLCLPPRATAGDPHLAVTDAGQADPDFFVQGEYLGQRLSAGSAPEATGLQVVAMGDGQFEGMVYRGGLPGWGWDQKSRWKVIGSRSEGAVILSGEPGLVRIVGNPPHAAEWASVEGEHRGSLERVVRQSRTMGRSPPAYANVLFDGTSVEAWQNGRISPEGLMMIGTATRRPVRDFALHLEFRTPYMPQARGQGRGNSGVYIQQRYEVQILDSFGLEGQNNECGSLYKARAPDLNMCLPPLSWQTYDIDFQAPRFASGGEKVASARITVKHNGVLVHRDVDVPNKTGGGEAEGPEPRPIKLQDHGNPVAFRNLWIVEYADGPCDPQAVSEAFSFASGASCGGDPGVLQLMGGRQYDPCCPWPLFWSCIRD